MKTSGAVVNAIHFDSTHFNSTGGSRLVVGCDHTRVRDHNTGTLELCGAQFVEILDELGGHVGQNGGCVRARVLFARANATLG